MPSIDLVVTSEIEETFRVAQIKGMFDLSLKDKLSHAWKMDLPIEGWDWNVGLIAGPSGSGKTSIARHVFGEYLHTGFSWSENKAIVDGFPPDVSLREVIETLTAVGFSSPPSWCKTFRVLSNGEKFRAELARALIEYEGRPMFVMDEFTSVVDRTVARIGSCAVSNAIRRRGGRMIALSCHYDIVDWLEPDWILDLKNNAFIRRRLRRPEISLEMCSVPRTTWTMFAKHHYLSGDINRSAQYYGCFWGPELVAFAAVLPSCGHKGIRRVHRLVVLPDYQGVGIGKALLAMLGDYYGTQGLRLTITSSHPGIVRGLAKDPHWRCSGYFGHGGHKHKGIQHTKRMAILASYEYQRT